MRMMDNALVSAVAAHCGDITEDDVRRVFDAWHKVKEGSPVGTVVRDPATGAIACRVLEDGVPAWKVTTMTGNEWRDMQPQLKGWTVISSPENPPANGS